MDQADQLRKLVRQTVEQHPALAPGVPLVVVSGGKGGVGVSTVATELAHELAALGKRTVLVDANPLQPDIANRFGLDVLVGLADVLDGSRSAIEVLQPLGESIRLLPGHWAADTPPELSSAALKRLLNELRSLHEQADIIVLDVGSGMSPWVQQLWKAAQQILLVSTDESVAVMDSYAAVKLSPWGDVDGKVRLVVNQSDNAANAETIGTRFAATCRRFLGIQVAPSLALTTRPDWLAAVTGREGNSGSRHYQRSLRLLAAEVMSTSLAVASTVAVRREAAANQNNTRAATVRERSSAVPTILDAPTRSRLGEELHSKIAHPEKSLQSTK